MSLTLKEYVLGVESGTFSPQEIVNQYLEKANEQNQKYHAFVRFHEDYVQNNIATFADRPLKGAPIGIKDMILTTGYISSSGAKILENYVSPYSSTCFSRLEEHGGLMIGKTNCDQFGMGSTTENSCFEATINPYGHDRVPGGSSGGSAAAVAADMCLGALGTDTGGSSRQPAAMCGVVGMKPTYGTNSRYGVTAYASSFDQVGVFAKTVEDSQILLSSIAGWDERDATTLKRNDIQDFASALGDVDISRYSFAIPKQFLTQGLDAGIKDGLMQQIDSLTNAGARVEEVDLPVLDNILSIYYTLVLAEASTNLARLDGIRYGFQKDTMGFDSVAEYYKAIRSEGFTWETKRRILSGTYVLSSANYEGYYLKASKARTYLKEQLAELFKTYDFIISPTSPSLSFKFGSFSDNPAQMYLEDLYTVTANLAGIPAISIPGGLLEQDGETLPWGLQLMAGWEQEKKLFSAAHWLEQTIGFEGLK